jgi:hypothetical protein
LDLKQRVVDDNARIKAMCKSWNNPVFEVFFIARGEVVLSSSGSAWTGLPEDYCGPAVWPRCWQGRRRLYLSVVSAFSSAFIMLNILVVKSF